MEHLRELLVFAEFAHKDMNRMLENLLRPVLDDPEELAAVARRIPTRLARDVTLWILPQDEFPTERLPLLRHLLDPHCVVPTEMKDYYRVHGDLVRCSPEMIRKFRKTLNL
jgi:hypothetical protein